MINYEIYLKEKNEFNSNYSLLNDKEKEVALKKYYSSLRRYLNLAIESIKNILGQDFSLYKRDIVMSASSYKPIETLVQKKKEEIELEINNLKNIEYSMNLKEEQKKEIELALEIISIYSNEEI